MTLHTQQRLCNCIQTSNRHCAPKVEVYLWFFRGKQKTWIKIEKINPEKNISVGSLLVIKTGNCVKEVIDKSQCCFAYVKK